MSNLPSVLCLSASPHLQVFNRPLLQTLAQNTPITQWEYCQTPDEPSSLEVALVLLHDHLKCQDHPMHLVGHGISGLLGLLYAQRHPERVRSLTLLSVGAHPAVDWQAHYYAQRDLLPCSRQALLTRMVAMLFGNSSLSLTKAVVNILERDLDHSLSPHSLAKRMSLGPIPVSVPLLVCGSIDDVVVDPNQLHSWRQYFSQDAETPSQLWVCPGGRYFFHYFYPEQVGEQILKFWRSLPSGQSRCSSANLRLDSTPELQSASTFYNSGS
ncbi:MAG: alpha/beta hydrolase [Leptolyngbyaceae bacterium]|nr:alpha/beta hydrolase [Leptolyngbyaceae bacterium]